MAMTYIEGTCKYCGQIISVQADDQSEADILATSSCNCEMAQLTGRLKRNISEAKLLVEEMFPREEDERNAGVVHELCVIIDVIGDGTFRSANLQVNGKVSVSIARTAKGTIKVSRTDKTKQVYETVE